MHIRLRCSKCGSSSRIAFADLCALWKEKYDALPTEAKMAAKAATRITCHCGNNDLYDSPMLNYVFQLVFYELVQNKTHS